MSDPLTYTYTIAEQENVHVTPTGLTPEHLLEGLYDKHKGRAKLVVLRDYDHRETQIQNTTAALLADKALGITCYLCEQNRDYQKHYEEFAKEESRKFEDLIVDPKKFRTNPDDPKTFEADKFEEATVNQYNKKYSLFERLVLNPEDAYAPDPQEHPEAWMEYYHAKWKTFETARDRKIGVRMFDAQNEALSDAADNAHNAMVYLARDVQIAQTLRDDKGNPIDVKTLKKKAEQEAITPEEKAEKATAQETITSLKKKMFVNIEKGGVRADQTAIDNTDIVDLEDLARQAMGDIGLNYNKAWSTKDIENAKDAKLLLMKKDKDKAENERDAWRNVEMAGLVVKEVESEPRALLLVGGGHLGKVKEGEEKNLHPNLEALLRNKMKGDMVRVDIIPVSPELAEKLGVCVGGCDGADFTIFVPGKRIQQDCLEQEKPVKASGPHKAFLDSIAPEQHGALPKQNNGIMVAEIGHGSLFNLPLPTNAPIPRTPGGKDFDRT